MNCRTANSTNEMIQTETREDYLKAIKEKMDQLYSKLTSESEDLLLHIAE